MANSWFDIVYEDPIKPGEPYPLFNRVSIETSSYCNRSCSFCPISTGRRPRQKLMEQEVFDKICDELSALRFSGVIQAFLLNEPTLDKTLKTKCERMREACPKASQYVSTNVDMLRSVQDLVELFDAGVNCVNLNVYEPGEEQHARITALAAAGVSAGEWRTTEHKYRRHSPSSRLVCVTDMRPERLTASATDQFYDRTAEDRHAGVPQHYCARPHRHVVILHDGTVPLCCALDPTDPRLAEDGLVLGNVSDSTLTELWNCPTMHKYRWFLQQKRRVLPGCSTCTHRMSYSHVVRQVTVDTETAARWEAELATPKLTQIT
jgi:MoaA/NifB/PqqE/SkfB family radical SAM enzyme